jgi:hypothetical protein
VWDFERRALLARFTTQGLREQQLERERIQQVGGWVASIVSIESVIFALLTFFPINTQQALASGSSADAIPAAAALEEEHAKEKDHASTAACSSDLARAARQQRTAWTALAAAARKQRQQDGGDPQQAPPLPQAGGRSSKAVAPLASQGKFGAIEALAFVDAGAVAHRLRGPPDTDGGSSSCEWQLAVLLEHRVVLLDLGGEARHILPFDLQKQTPTALEPLSMRFLALGCGDGQVRIWDMRKWELAAPAFPAHAKEVRHLRALLSSPHAQSHFLRLVSLGLDGSALLWHAPVAPVGRIGSAGLEVDPRGLRAVMRLEGTSLCVH